MSNSNSEARLEVLAQARDNATRLQNGTPDQVFAVALAMALEGGHHDRQHAAGCLLME